MIELFKDRLSNSTSQHGLRTCTEFIDQYKCINSCLFNEIFHVQQVGAVCTQVVINGLLIPNINKYPGKNSKY